jgi:hypothetical protein
MGTTISIGTVLFSDDFSTDTKVSPTQWTYVQYEPSNNPAFLGRTETNQFLPSIVNGAAHLTVDTYLSGQGAGVDFAGTAIYTLQSFPLGSTGIVFTVIAKLDQAEAGLVGGIFPYMLLPPTPTDPTAHNEIDTELVSNDPASLSVNTYADQPLGAGSGQNVQLPQGDSVTQWNTYQMVWTANQITWYVDGEQVAMTTSNVPTGSMPLYLNFWVPDDGPNGWPYAYNAELQPVNTASADTTYGFDVASVEVAQLAPCFAAGTRIATERGEMAIEAIRIGERVRVLLGDGLAAVIWVGQRELDCTRHSQPQKVWPVRVAAEAFGPGQPHTDLFLSPDHAVYVGEVLIPVKHLINGGSIAQMSVERVTYYHLELTQHNVLLAEGLPAESFLDTKDGSKYAKYPGSVTQYADFQILMWEAFGCAPLIVSGQKLELARMLVEGFTAGQDA